jgi:threonine/homoserine/homoserine lactone efflux protein
VDQSHTRGSPGIFRPLRVSGDYRPRSTSLLIAIGCLLALIDIVYEAMLALIASVLREWLTRSQRFAVWRQRVTGAVLIGLGVRLVLTGRE